MATLGEHAVGSIVKMNVNGTSRDFIVVHQGLPGTMYDSSCNGTWLLMKDIYSKRAFDSSDHDYANSSIHSYLNKTFITLFDDNISSKIKQAKIPYRAGKGDSATVTTGSSGLSVKAFLLSYTELGYGTHEVAPVEGAVLSYFKNVADSRRIGYYNGSATNWWLRTPNLSSNTHAWYVYKDNAGSSGTAKVTSSYGMRPALILPSDTAVSSDGIVGDSGAITGSVIVDGVQRELTGAGYINIGGVLRELSDSQVDIGGVLKSLKG